MRSLAHSANGLSVLAVESGKDDPAAVKPDSPTGGRTPQSNNGAGAAWLMAGSILFGVGLGYALDLHFGTSPRWTIVLSMLFLVVGVYLTIREASR